MSTAPPKIEMRYRYTASDSDLCANWSIWFLYVEAPPHITEMLTDGYWDTVTLHDGNGQERQFREVLVPVTVSEAKRQGYRVVRGTEFTNDNPPGERLYITDEL